MKRGLMDWRKDLLPEEALVTRRDKFVSLIKDNDLDCAVIFGDVASADELFYLTNFAPYWSDGAAIVTKEGQYQIVTGLSARVNHWVMEITGFEEKNVMAAGPKLSAKVVSLLQKLLPVGGKVGLVGNCTPYKLVTALQEAGFKLSFLESAQKELLASRDQAYSDTLKEGADLLNNVLHSVFNKLSQETMTRKTLALEIEHKCRMQGVTDILILTAGEDLAFSLTEEPEEPGPWTFFIQMQYLGEWLVMARPVGLGQGVAELTKVREKVGHLLKPGKLDINWADKEMDVLVRPMLLSDHLSCIHGAAEQLYPGQAVSVSITDRNKGLYMEDVFMVTDQGGQQLTTI